MVVLYIFGDGKNAPFRFLFSFSVSLSFLMFESFKIDKGGKEMRMNWRKVKWVFLWISKLRVIINMGKVEGRKRWMLRRLRWFYRHFCHISFRYYQHNEAWPFLTLHLDLFPKIYIFNNFSMPAFYGHYIHNKAVKIHSTDFEAFVCFCLTFPIIAVCLLLLYTKLCC